MPLKSVTDETFHVLVRERVEPTVLIFTGSWCQPCKKFLPVVEKLAERVGSYVEFMVADIEEAEKTASELGIKTVPTLVMFDGGMQVAHNRGSMSSNDLRLWVTENLL